jgi:predicted TIM-barrel fold metal-dependent hydrolase
MARYYKVISGDGHLETPPDTFTKYVPEKWKNRAPQLLRMPEGGEAWLIEGQPLLHNGQNITGGGPIRFKGGSYYNPDGSPAEGAGPAAQRLREQDRDGIDAEVLFPPVFASRFIESIREREVYCAMVSAYNTFLAQDYCAVAPDRLIGNATLPITGIDDAIAEMKRVRKLGIRSVSFYNFPNGTGFAKPEDDKFWEMALELGMKLSPHFGFGAISAPMGGAAQGTSDQAFATAIVQRAGSHAPVFCMAQLIASGVFDRFPEIEFYFAETNACWLPATLFFLDDSYRLFKDFFKVNLKLTPSEYIKKHIWFGIIRDPVAFQLGNLVPLERLMWGSDFPHSVGSYPRSREFLETAFKPVGEELKRRILLENPARYYGLDLGKPITETPAN